MQITVGDVFKIVVGKSTLTMDKEGHVTITGTTFTTDFTDAVKHWGKVIDLNPSRSGSISNSPSSGDGLGNDTGGGPASGTAVG